MTVIIPNGFVQIVLDWTGDLFDSGGGATVLGHSLTDDDQAQMQDLADEVRDSWVANLRGNTSDHVTLAAVRVLTETRAAQRVVNVAGTNAGDTCPPNTSVLVKHQTARRGPRGRGRAFWPGHAYEAEVSDTGALDEDYRDTLQGLFDAFYDDVDTAVGGSWVVLQGDQGESAPIAPPPAIATKELDGRVASQRRRLRK
jgi:hypothetical protein